MVQKVKPKCYIDERYIDDERRTLKKYIEYRCAGCNRIIPGYRSENACEYCGTFHDWDAAPTKIVTNYSME